MKLFVATEYLADLGAILATRRRRSPADQEIWAAHLAIVDGDTVGKPEVETDRARFLGRGHGVRTADCCARWREFVEHGWHRARSDLRHSTSCADRPRRDRADRILDRGR